MVTGSESEDVAVEFDGFFQVLNDERGVLDADFHKGSSPAGCLVV